MLKKFPWKTVLLTLLAWTLFWEIKETLTGERMLFVYRWLYSDKSHAKNIEILTYLLTDDQVSYMFSHPNEPVKQLSSKELSMKNVNAVLRIRNLTDGIAYGKLAWSLDKRGWSTIDISEIPGPRESMKYSNVVIPLGIVIATRGNTLPPELITTRWDKLYLYR